MAKPEFLYQFQREKERQKRHGELSFNGQEFGDFLNHMGTFCPEITEKQDGLLHSAAAIVADHNVKSEFFKAEDNRIGLLFASTLHLETTRTTGKSDKRLLREIKIASLMAHTLFGRYSDIHPLEDVRNPSDHAPEDELRIYKKYQNAALSKRLHNWVLTSEEMASAREALHISGEQAEQFEMVVLSIAHPFHTRGMGEAENAPEGIKEYVEMLHEKGKSFMAEAFPNMDRVVPYGWVSPLLGKKYLCISEAAARVILEPQAVGFQDNGGDLRDSQIKILKHEFVHTQGDLLIDNHSDLRGDVYLGVLLEEYRAEVCSQREGEGSYPDIYRTVRAVQAFKGFDLGEYMTSIPLAGAKDKEAFYGGLAAKLGLVDAAMLTALLPKDYASLQAPKSSREIYECLKEDGIKKEVLFKMDDTEFENYLRRYAIKGELRKTLERNLAQIKEELK